VQDSQWGWHKWVKPKYFAIFWLLLMPQQAIQQIRFAIVIVMWQSQRA